MVPAKTAPSKHHHCCSRIILLCIAAAAITNGLCAARGSANQAGFNGGTSLLKPTKFQPRLRHLISLPSPTIPATSQRAELARLCSSKDWSKAIRILDSLVSQFGAIQDICNRAFCYSQLELHKHVIKDCDRAFQLDPTLLQAYILKVRFSYLINVSIAWQDLLVLKLHKRSPTLGIPFKQNGNTLIKAIQTQSMAKGPRAERIQLKAIAEMGKVKTYMTYE
ncbi:hypothetical protein VNO77_22496 [Canavalia gladiata]|uniref:Uncharacterized protein n=1 Tax=Canavalia gladiata TaxID=3824 RepID=A0AAN9L444_CANGL